MSTTFPLFVFSYKMKTNHTSLVLSGVCTDLMPCLSRTEETNEVRLGLVTFFPLLLRHRYLQWPWPLSPSVLTHPLPLQFFRCIRAYVGGERQCVLNTLLLILPVSFLSAVARRDEKA